MKDRDDQNINNNNNNKVSTPVDEQDQSDQIKIFNQQDQYFAPKAVAPKAEVIEYKKFPWGDAFKSALKAAYRNTYPFAGLDPVNKQVVVGNEIYDFRMEPKQTLLGHKRGKYFSALTGQGNLDDYEFDPLTIITTLLGIPVKMPKNGIQTWSNVGKNLLFGTPNPEDLSTAQKIAAGTWNVLTLVPRVLFNIALSAAKLATQFLPEYIANNFKVLRFGAKHASENPNYHPITRLLAWVGSKVAGGCEIAFRIVNFVGRAITSPINGARAGWALGKELAGEGTAGKILGGVLFGLSVSVTIVTYAFIWPVALKALGTVALPYLGTHLPSAITSAANWLAPKLSAVGSAISQAVANTIVPTFKAFGLNNAVTALTSASPLYVGITAVAAALIPTLGTFMSSVVGKKISDWWNTPKKKEVLEQEEPGLDVVNPITSENKKYSQNENNFQNRNNFRNTNNFVNGKLPQQQKNSLPKEDNNSSTTTRDFSTPALPMLRKTLSAWKENFNDLTIQEQQNANKVIKLYEKLIKLIEQRDSVKEINTKEKGKNDDTICRLSLLNKQVSAAEQKLNAYIKSSNLQTLNYTFSKTFV